MKLSELQHELRTAEPAAILVAPRILERVIRQEQQLPNLLWRIPHRKCYVVDRHVLFRHVEQDELDLESDRLLPSTVILLTQPTSEELGASDSQPLRLAYWRLLFHARLHLALQTLQEEGTLPAAAIQERIDELGPVEFAEIRRVLTEDGYLLPAADDRAVYIEFAAVFLELQFFAASLLPTCFPALRDFAAVNRLLRRDVDPADLLNRTRLAGAPEPVVRSDSSADESHAYYWRLVGAADRAAAVGNTVRAAIVRTRAARVAPGAYTAATRAQADADLQHLVRRLQAALELTDAEAVEWRKDLPALLEKADQGTRPVEAALLFELQNVCLDHERDTYALDLVEWLLTAGKRPIKRPLPSQRVVRKVKHLRSAAQLLARARLSDGDRAHLARLLQTALDRGEQALCDRFRPMLSETFHDVGLQPTSPPERVAFHKLIDELLDRIIEYGFLTFGDLRDALSRNQLKLPDLTEPDDFLRGDPLLRLDGRLATLLDGVYRPAEAYLRWLEWFTAIGFGTTVGRLLTRFVIVPFGGGALLNKALAVVLELLHGPPLPEMAQYAAVVLFGVLLLGLLHVPSFRQRCLRGLKGCGHLLHTVFVAWPERVLQVTAMRQFVGSWPFRLLAGYVLKPLAACALLNVWLPEAFQGWLAALSTFFAANFILNSRIGLAASEALVQGLVRFYDLLRAGLLPGLVRLIVAAFKRIIDTLEYLLFTVDEWLRFRSGDSRASMAVRTVLGVLWFPVSYLARFYMVVLIEPGLNPIKFPVSSLAAKFIYPFGVTLVGGMTELLTPISGGLIAGVVAGTTVWLLPDAFGFLFWEMKENWRLYRANRPPNLQAVVVGTHGETVRHLLQPGFHSGTLPKLFARLRRAERLAAGTGNWQGVRVCRQELQRVERALQRLLAREVVELVKQSPHWHGRPLEAGRVVLASNRISLELTSPDLQAGTLWLDIDDRAGWLMAGLRGPGWREDAAPEQRQVLKFAVAGFYKLAGVDLVREQVEANLPPEATAYDITLNALIVWLGERGGRAVLYDWATLDGLLDPRAPDGDPAPEWPVLDQRRLVFGSVPLAWEHWVDVWQRDQAGQGTLPPFDVEFPLTPVGQST